MDKKPFETNSEYKKRKAKEHNEKYLSKDDKKSKGVNLNKRQKDRIVLLSAATAFSMRGY